MLLLAQGKKGGHIKSAAIGMILSLCMICLGAGLLALLIHINILAEESTKYGSFIVLLLSLFTGNVVSIKGVGQRRWLACLLHAAAVFLCLIIISITIYGGPKGGVSATAFVISGVAMAALLLFGKERQTRSKLQKFRRHS